MADRIQFGVVQIGLECWYGQAGAYFNFHGSDEGTEVSGDGDGDGEIEEDGTLQGEIRFHNGKQYAVHRTKMVNFRSLLKAVRMGTRTLIDVPHGLAWPDSLPPVTIRAERNRHEDLSAPR